MQGDFFKLLFGNRGFECCEKIYSLHTRLPKLFNAPSIKQTIHFLSCFPQTVLNERTDSHIFHLLCAQCRLFKQIEEDRALQAQLFTKLLKARHSTYGIVIAVSNLDKYEFFTKEHIEQGIQHLLSGVRPVEESYFDFTWQQTRFFYLEIKKMRGGFFSKDEVKKLNTSLNAVLKEKIENTFKPIVLPGLEESIFKHIKHLSNELTHVDDIPQVMISFTEYSEHKLILMVIILRVVQKNSPSLTTLVAQSTSSIKIFLEKSFVVELLDKKYPKEASIFKIQLNPVLCIQKKKVNLRIARQCVKKIIEDSFGEVRDFNGGLMIKEEEQLLKIKQACKEKGIQSFLLEDLFYSIQPTYMRTLITNQTGVNLFLLLQKLKNKPIPEGLHHCYETFVSGSTEIVVIKTNKKNWLLQILSVLPNSQHQIGYSHLLEEKVEYLCIFDQCYKPECSLLKTIKQHIKKLYADPASDSKNILRLNLQGGDPSSLNPRLASDIQCHTLCNLLFEGLTRINEAGEPEPALAKSIEISPSGLHYVFHLRTSAWSNGEEVTAYDFERSWKKGIMDNVPSFLCPKLFFYIKNARQARDGDLPLNEVGICAKDRKTLEVELETPCRYFLHLVSTPLFFPLCDDAEEPEHFNGPFYLEEWKHNAFISLSRNPFCWNSKDLEFKGIKFYMENDSQKILTRFLNNELDMIGDPLSPLTPDILRMHAVENKLISKPVSRIFWMHCNIHAFPLNNKLVRQSLNLALDRKKIASEAFYKQIPHSSPLPGNYTDFSLNLEGDPSLAKAKFEQALVELKIEKEDFPPLKLIHSNLAFEKKLAEELKNQWKSILGIQLLTEELPWSDFSSALEKGDFQLAGLFRRDLFNHPQYYLSFFRQSSQNPHSLNNAEYEQLFNKIDYEDNNLETIKQMEKLLIDEVPVLPLICQVYFGLVQDHIKGFNWFDNGCLGLKDVVFDENQ